MEFLIIVFPQQGLSAVIEPFSKNMYYSLYHLLYPIDSGYAGAEHRGLNGNQNKTEQKILHNSSNLIKLVGGKPDFILMIQPITTRQITKKKSTTGATKNLKKSPALNELNMKETKGAANLRRFRLFKRPPGGTGEVSHQLLEVQRGGNAVGWPNPKKILILQIRSY